ncbi:MAG: ester cyclase [Chloroflexi bacterium]|nr:ester cyclase [Chloroflexota bacterium]
MAADFVSHNPSPGFGADRAGQKAVLQAFAGGHAGGMHEVLDQVAESDRVMTRVRAWGTQTGSLFGIPPTGKRIEFTGIAIHRVRDSQLVEHWHEIDMLTGLQQLGVVPTPPRDASLF